MTSFPSLPTSGGCKRRFTVAENNDIQIVIATPGSTVTARNKRKLPVRENPCHVSTPTIASGKIKRYETKSDAAVRWKKLLHATLIMPNVMIDSTRARYADSTS